MQNKRVISSLFILFLILVVPASDVLSATAPPVGSIGSSCESSVVPLYSNPNSGLWAELVQDKPSCVGMYAVIDPANGPGSTIPLGYSAGISSLRAAGIKVAGYVPTEFGANSIASVEANVGIYAKLYGLSAIYLDEVSVSDLSYYRAIIQNAGTLGINVTIGNPGESVNASYFQAFTILNVYETTGYPSISQFAGDPKSQTSIVINQEMTLDPSFVSEVSSSVGYVFITDSAYSDLPTYMSAEMDALSGTTSQISVTQTSQTLSSTSVSQTLVSTTSPLTVHFNPVNIPDYFGTDIGPVSWTTSLQGFTWNSTDEESLTFGSPPICLPSSILFNSSITSLQCASFSAFFKPEIGRGQRNYTTMIELQGISTGAQICIPLSAVGGQVIYNKTANPFQANLGNLELNWQDISPSMNPAFTGASLCYTPPVGSYSIDPLAIDGSGNCLGSFGSGGGTCGSVFTTSHTSDVLYCYESFFSATSAQEPIVMSSSPSLTWHLRTRANYNAGGTGINNTAFYAIWSGSGSVTVTADVVSAPAGTNFLEGQCIGVSGAYMGGSPFDTNPSVPGTAHSTTGVTSLTLTITTNNANDFLITDLFPGWNGGSGTTAPSGFTASQGGGGGQGWGYKIVSSALSSTAITWSFGSSPASILFDAICSSAGCGSSAVSQGIKITTLPSSVPSGDFATVTISGCSPSNSTFTADGYLHTYSLSASCTVTLTLPNCLSNSCYLFSIWPHPTSNSFVTFTTCAGPSACSNYLNDSFYDLNNELQVTSHSPTTFDGAFLVDGTCTFLGIVETGPPCFGMTTTAGTSTASDTTLSDYDTAVTAPAMIGYAWVGQSPLTCNFTTGGNVCNVNYIVSSGIGFGAVFGILLIGGILVGFMLIAVHVSRRH